MSRCVYGVSPGSLLLRPGSMLRVVRRPGEAFARLLDVVRAWFSYADFLGAVEKWPHLYRLALAYPGLRPGRCLGLYEALVNVVVKQRVALRVALSIGARLVERYGPR